MSLTRKSTLFARFALPVTHSMGIGSKSNRGWSCHLSCTGAFASSIMLYLMGSSSLLVLSEIFFWPVPSSLLLPETRCLLEGGVIISSSSFLSDSWKKLMRPIMAAFSVAMMTITQMLTVSHRLEHKTHTFQCNSAVTWWALAADNRYPGPNN